MSTVAAYLLVSAVPIKLIICYSKRKLKSIAIRTHKNTPSGSDHHKPNSKAEEPHNESNFKELKEIRSRTIIICLSLNIFLSIILGVIPHMPSVNKDEQQIGTDSSKYVKWTNALFLSNSTANFTRQAFFVQSSGERPLSLITIYGILKLLGEQNSLISIEYLPLALGPLLVLVIYFLTLELTSNHKASLFASFLSAISFQTIIGIYAGYYANWISLIVGYSSFFFLIKFLKERAKKNLFLFSILTIATLLSHQYTAIIFAIIMVTFLVIISLTGRHFKFYSLASITALILVVLIPVVVEIGKTVTIGSTGGIIQDIAKVQSGLGVDQFATRWDTLNNTISIYLGGQLSNFIILFLGLYWLIISRLRDLSSFFILIFLSIGIIPVFIGDQLIQGRILYDIPFQIPADTCTYAYYKNQRLRTCNPDLYLAARNFT